jgi:hypothetical protein
VRRIRIAGRQHPADIVKTFPTVVRTPLTLSKPSRRSSAIRRHCRSLF